MTPQEAESNRQALYGPTPEGTVVAPENRVWDDANDEGGVACASAQQRRGAGIDLPLSPRSDAIDESEEVTAIAGAIAPRDTAPNDRINALFDALVNVRTRGTRNKAIAPPQLVQGSPGFA